jgi:hypothetical protein
MAEEAEVSEVAIQTPVPSAVSRPKPPAPGQETQELVNRASQGDQSCLPAVRALLADGGRGEFFREGYGSSAEWLRQSIIEKAAGPNIVAQEAIRRKIDAVQAELAGENPTPIERLLAERASLCWFLVNWHENSLQRAKGMSVTRVDLQQRKIDRAHGRFLSAVRTLAQIRKLALPTLQLNVARNQINVARAQS